jgi:hypothetical protein
MLEFLELVEGVVEARLPVLPPSQGPEGTGNGSGSSMGLGGRNWRPPVLPNQREALTLLRAVRSEDARVWGRVFDLLTRLATAHVNSSNSSSTTTTTTAATAASSEQGGFTRVPVSKQFAKEAADCLMELYGQEHIPLPARAGAFDAIVRSLGGACLACSHARRRERRRGEWAGILARSWQVQQQQAAQVEGGTDATEAEAEAGVAGAGPFVPSLAVSFPQPLAAVQASGALLTPVLRAGLEAVQACSSASLAGGEEQQQDQQQLRRRGRSRSQEQEEADRGRERERQAQLQKTWHHAVLVVEGYLIPWQPAEGAAAAAAEDAAQQLAAAAAAAGEGEGSYATVGGELLRAMVEAVLGFLDVALTFGAADQLVDVLIDALLAQSTLGSSGGGGDGSKPPAAASSSSSEGEGQAPSPTVFEGVLGHLRALLEALIDRAVQPPAAVVVKRQAGAAAPQRQSSAAAATAAAMEEESNEEEAQARVRGMAVRATRRLVAGVLHASRWIVEVGRRV